MKGWLHFSFRDRCHFSNEQPGHALNEFSIVDVFVSKTYGIIQNLIDNIVIISTNQGNRRKLEIVVRVFHAIPQFNISSNLRSRSKIESRLVDGHYQTFFGEKPENSGIQTLQ
jgi:hypothetical protein